MNDNHINPETDQPKLLIYLHIPKAGGTTLHKIIRRQYPKQSVLWFSYDRPEKLAQYEAMDESDRRELRCLCGHIPFGIHEAFKSIPSTYITMLRDPVSRLVSEYGYIKRNPRSGSWRPPQERLKSLEDYLDYRIETNTLNVQTRFISGALPPPKTPAPFEAMPADALSRAKENLQTHFLVSGTVRRYDESILLMKRRLGWKNHIFYTRQRTAPQSHSNTDIPPKLLKRIVEHTAIDSELVDFAEGLLDETIAAEDDSFHKELGKLHRVNDTIFKLSSTWKRIVPVKLRDAPGFRHIKKLGYRILR